MRAVRAYQLLPEAIVPAVGYGLPILELVIGALLIVGLATRITAAISSVLLVAFIIGIASAWARGLQIECGCFGGGGTVEDATSKYPWEIARDVGLLLLSGALVLWPRTALSLDAAIRSRRGVRRMSKKNRQSTQARQGDAGGCAQGRAAPPQSHRRRDRRSWSSWSSWASRILVQQNRNDTSVGHAAPAGVTADNGVVRGDAGAPVTVVMYEDFQCPVCKQMEGLHRRHADAERRRQARSDRVPTRSPSSTAHRRPTTPRARSATAACALDEGGADTYFALHELLFANQPAEGTAGLSDEELAGLAEQAGADKAARRDVPGRTARSTAGSKAATDAWSKAGFTGTPTILVDGKQVEFTNDTRPAADASARDRRSRRQLSRRGWASPIGQTFD